MSDLVTLLVVLSAFQLKHLICDFLLQTRYQVENKGFYGDIGGLAHATCHLLFSIPVLLILTQSVPLIAPALIFEFFVHYHMDWFKARLVRLKNWSTLDYPYWIAFGVDQFVHQMTYVAMLAWLMLRGVA